MASTHPSYENLPNAPAIEERDPLLGASTSLRSAGNDETNETINARRGPLARATTFPLLQAYTMISVFGLILYYNDLAFKWFYERAWYFQLAFLINIPLVLFFAWVVRRPFIIGVLSYLGMVLAIIITGLEAAKSKFRLQLVLMAVAVLLALYTYTYQTRFGIVSPVAFVFVVIVVAASSVIINLLLPFSSWSDFSWILLLCPPVYLFFTFPYYLVPQGRR